MIAGSAGDDMIDGSPSGEITHTLVVGRFALDGSGDVTITPGADGLTVSGPDGVDRLVGVDAITFVNDPEASVAAFDPTAARLLVAGTTGDDVLTPPHTHATGQALRASRATSRSELAGATIHSTAARATTPCTAERATTCCSAGRAEPNDMMGRATTRPMRPGAGVPSS